MSEKSKNSLDSLINIVAKLPGLGPRSAKRTVLHMLKNKDILMYPLSDALQKAADEIVTCQECGNMDVTTKCYICSDDKRDRSIICVVEEVADLWAFERGRIYKGVYIVLGGTLSALDGRSPSDLNIAKLIDKASKPDVTEVILATNATVEGQTTAHYISDRLAQCNVKISILAQGIPIGGELDYMDEGTLNAALNARKIL